ncbi:LysM peptidoglycan-binding domain-containing M23 family metallopeptidase [Candidatus Berkelbacteria bacterium]|nr:LysM peptidoglycan-binding domain-containing M23 family metallopeptidase [Candidatus Berkelbacteria bacterium]
MYASSAQQQYLNFEPILANGILASLDQYTPIINESNVDLNQSIDSTMNSGFVGRENVENQFVTEATKLETQYSVQDGDTITAIADKFGLHVATIAERNNISIDEIEKIAPGKILIIPPTDTTDSKNWLVQLNQKKEEERTRKLAEAKKQAQEQERRLARGKTTTRERVSGGFSGSVGTNFIVPIAHNGITRGVSRFHMGIDYRANEGTSVKVAQTGRVIEVTKGWAGGFGISVLVDHGGGLTTRYAHLSRVAVGAGEDVSQGQVIAYSGNTGFSTGPHLHFETRRNGSVLTPF